MRLTTYLSERVKLTGDDNKDKLIKQLQKWTSDLKKLTKAYKAIPVDREPSTLKIFLKVRKAFNIFGDNFETWIYGGLMTRERSGDESCIAQRVRTDAWRAIMSIRDLFPSSYYNPDGEPWELTKKRKESNIRLYQRQWRTAEKAIMDMIEYELKEIDFKENPTEKYQIGTAKVVVHNYGKHKSSDETLTTFMKSIKGVISKLKQKGFKNIDKNLVLHAYYDPRAPDTGTRSFTMGGNYNYVKDILNIFIMGMDKDGSTLIHELGHRFYFRSLPENARKVWYDLIKTRKIEIKKEHVDKFHEHHKNVKVDDIGYDDPGNAEFKKRILKELGDIDEIELSVFEEFLTISWFKDPEQLKRMCTRKIGNIINLEHITDYGNTDPEEAFAEAFRLYIFKGLGSLKPWTRQFFKDICRSAGVIIKEEKKMRLTHYLTEEFQESRNVAILDNHLEQIKKTSKPWIKIAKPYPIFRGLKATSAVVRKKVRTDRRSKDTPRLEHEVVDQAFFNAFGWYPRSSGLFVVGDAITARGYGDLMLIFPIGKVSYLYSDYFSDLYMSLKGMSWDAGVEKYPDPDDPRNIKAATPEELKYITDKYTDKNILNILKRTSAQPEIMINCKEYWAINIEVAFDWLIQRGLLESRYLFKKGAEMFMKEAILK